MNVPIDVAESYYTDLADAGHQVALQVIETRHAELFDPSDAAGAQAVAAILEATRGEPAIGVTARQRRRSMPG